MNTLLRRLRIDEVPTKRFNPVDEATLSRTREIVEAVQQRGEDAVREFAVKFGEAASGEPLVRDAAWIRARLDDVAAEDRELLERVAGRIHRFAAAQRKSLVEAAVAIPGGVAGHHVLPVESAGCYAPGGRFPLPSSVLMTCVTARAAGVPVVVAASPKPTPITIAAAAVAGADFFLAAGGAHAIAAMAFGACGLPACDMIVGPGNRWVTAAKQLLFGRVGIDMLAGPSELVILADDSATPSVVAADLLAQAEHDVDALPILISDSVELLGAVERELETQLASLPTASTARPALANGFAVAVRDMEEGVALCNRLAPEHLEVLCRNAADVATRLTNYGGLFIGEGSAEVLGDYGAGPNHTLPTGGTARFTGGLSVFNFLRVNTWLRIDDRRAAQRLLDDTVALARHEGLEGHVRSARQRLL